MSVADQPEVRRLLLALSERPMEVVDPEIRRIRRERAIVGIQNVLRDARNDAPSHLVTVSRWAKISMVTALAAGLAVAIGQWARVGAVSRSSPLRVMTAAGDAMCRLGTDAEWQPCRVEAGQTLTGVRCLEGATTELETRVGARLVLMPASTLLASDDLGQSQATRVRLTQGRVDVKVPKLGPGQSFAVETDTATVTVHGTEFSVSILSDAHGKSSTCVELREGVVTVESGGRAQRLVAPALLGCETEADKPATDVESEPAEASPPKSETGSATAKRKSTLGLEIRLLQQGLGAEQRHERAAAERFYRGLLKRYPNSVVAPEARAALERLQQGI